MSVQARLRQCMVRGSLSVADLAKWFDRPYPTVRSWVQWDTEPRGPRLGSIETNLLLLEKLIKQKRGFPIPVTIGHYDRPQHIRQLRDLHGRNRKLPGPDPARKRAAVRVRTANKK